MSGPEPSRSSSLDGISQIGELAIVASAAGFVVSHRDDIGRRDLGNFDVGDAVEVARLDDAGTYRPLKTAPNLRHGWKISTHHPGEIAQIIDAIYPGRLAALRAWQSSRLTPVPLRETLDRQSGMYRIAATISDAQIDELVGTFCQSKSGCLRTILWKRDAGGSIASSRLPATKFDPAMDQFVISRRLPPRNPAGHAPLLCQEACNLLVAAARKVARDDE